MKARHLSSRLGCARNQPLVPDIPAAPPTHETKPRTRACFWVVLAIVAAIGSVLIVCVAGSVLFAAIIAITLDAPAGLNSGALYDPASSSWTEMSKENAPSGRYNPYAFWTGNEMLIWGGFIERRDFPVNDTVAVGGGGLYRPATNSWRKMSSEGDPGGRGDPVVVWTGSELIVWGGRGHGGRGEKLHGDGARFNPTTNEWTKMSEIGAPSPRYNSVGIWTGSELIVWSGSTSASFVHRCGTYVADGARYDPAIDRWSPVATDGAPIGSWDPAAIWTGKELILWGGEGIDDRCRESKSGARYDPATNKWTPLPDDGPFLGEIIVQAWTGGSAFVWGSSVHIFDAPPLPPGGVWNPSADEWMAVWSPPMLDGIQSVRAREDQGRVIVIGKARGSCPPKPLIAMWDGNNRDWDSVTVPPEFSGSASTIMWNGESLVLLFPGVPIGWTADGCDASPTMSESDGWHFSRSERKWTPVDANSHLQQRVAPAVIWTGSEFIVWGGLERD